MIRDQFYTKLLNSVGKKLLLGSGETDRNSLLTELKTEKVHLFSIAIKTHNFSGSYSLTATQTVVTPPSSSDHLSICPPPPPIEILNRLKRYLSPKTLFLMYKTFILGSLIYGILVWGYSTDRLFNRQKRAVRLISKSKFNAHTDLIFKKSTYSKNRRFAYTTCIEMFSPAYP